ncbi:DnaJ domain-containing protein [Anaeromyxobacter oryzae]|uniref:J domain-containing protein n=1 Tax=Anaeromyxobacter oryzae TaxID=2918170 RepID=A0ABM7WWP5_9BACT|nr:DnaJ domain-containing protein [Anaeromyxobacter oryzae]BDG03921.1 hypothetical protein AMOR_29170 [Anaeromyxobacter oryzae]
MAKTEELTLEDVIAAGRVLFGPRFAPDGQGWRAELKTTYRRRALETHPDRARAVGRTESDLSREFRRVAEAYRVLSALRAGPLPAPVAPRERAAPPPPAAPPRRPAPAPRAARAGPAGPVRPHPPTGPGEGRPAAAARGWTGSPRAEQVRAAPRAAAAPSPRVPAPELPRRRLRFAEYLYYSGRVPWTALVEALSWQRCQRPAIGRIAVDWGFLAPEDVAAILERRRAAAAQRIPFGEFAVRLGYLTSFQLLALLGRQLRQQQRIGAWFVERGLLDAEEIDAIRVRIARHNARWRE